MKYDPQKDLATTIAAAADPFGSSIYNIPTVSNIIKDMTTETKELRPPNVEIVTYEKINNKVSFIFQNTVGSKNMLGVEINFLLEKPLSMNDFLKAKKEVVKYDKSGIDATIKPGQKYYFCFRSYYGEDVGQKYSFLGSVYMIQLIDNGPNVTPVVEVLNLRTNPPETKEIHFKKTLRIQPTFLQSVLDKEKRTIGVVKPSTFSDSRKFKLRVTSKKTGRKIDLNVLFKKKEFKFDKTSPLPPTQIQPNQISGNIDTAPEIVPAKEKKTICQPIEKNKWSENFEQKTQIFKDADGTKFKRYVKKENEVKIKEEFYIEQKQYKCRTRCDTDPQINFPCGQQPGNQFCEGGGFYEVETTFKQKKDYTPKCQLSEVDV